MLRTILTFLLILILLGMFFPNILSVLAEVLEKGLILLDKLLSALLSAMPS